MYPLPGSPFSEQSRMPFATSRTSTKSYPPQTAKGSFPARKDFAIEVKLPPCKWPGPLMQEGKTILAFSQRSAASKTNSVAVALLLA